MFVVFCTSLTLWLKYLLLFILVCSLSCIMLNLGVIINCYQLIRNVSRLAGFAACTREQITR